MTETTRPGAAPTGQVNSAAPFAKFPDGRTYTLTRDVARHDGVLVLGVLTDDGGAHHLAVATGETIDSFSFLLAQIDADQVAAVEVDGPSLRRLILTSPRTARLTSTFDLAVGDYVDVETVVPAGGLTEDELPDA